jgi:hypothetical protein
MTTFPGTLDHTCTLDHQSCHSSISATVRYIRKSTARSSIHPSGCDKLSTFLSTENSCI